MSTTRARSRASPAAGSTRPLGAPPPRSPALAGPPAPGMPGVLMGGGRDGVAGGEVVGAGPHLDHDAAQRVAKRRVGVQPVHDLLVGGDRALLRDRVEHLADLVRPRPRLADHRHLGLGQLHHLRAGGDEREERLHQHTAGTAHRGRHVEDAELPGFVVLRYLLHRILCSTVRLARAAAFLVVMPTRPWTERCDTTAPAPAAAISAWNRPRGPPARPV